MYPIGTAANESEPEIVLIVMVMAIVYFQRGPNDCKENQTLIDMV